MYLTINLFHITYIFKYLYENNLYKIHNIFIHFGLALNTIKAVAIINTQIIEPDIHKYCLG